ncbi:major facilitator superfamily domain-containing protein [Scenedesmus sp. NREL 46B-D3]|nr:major facilitator superfamily domain-containing protein [Scenedesmus sp. NREL 46B-D3]
MLVLLASSCSWATMALVVLDMVFTTQKPAWTCSNPADTHCAAILSRGAGFCGLSPQQYTWAAPHSSLVSSFGLVCSDSWKVGLVNATFFVGYWVGSCMFGWLADAYGRKRCLLLSNGTLAAAALLCASSRSYRQYVLWRAAQGFCAAGLPIGSYVLSTEAVGPAYRGRAGTASQMVYHAGEWLLPLLAFWLQDWRLLNLAIAAVCCITGPLLLPLPESPRWLLLQGRQQEARSALSWLAALNGRQLPEDLDITHVVDATAAATEARALAGNSAAAADGRPAGWATDASAAGTGCRDALAATAAETFRAGKAQQ